MEIHPGWQIGRDDDPHAYTLERLIQEGGEGQLWRARWRDKHDFAVKVFKPDRSTPKHQERLRNATFAVHSWQIEGILPPTEEFDGPPPHPAGAYVPGDRHFYQVTPLIGGVDLRDWHGWGHGVTAAAAVISELCRIIEALHGRGAVHRDISFGNVMVRPDGKVLLIDLSYLGDASEKLNPMTVSFAAPEVRENGCSPATDRFSVGAVAYYLLTRELLPDVTTRWESAAVTARRVLLERGWSAEVAAHLTSLLADDPGRRPRRLAHWGEALHDLVAADAPRRFCADHTSDRYNEVAVFTGGLGGVHVTDTVGFGRLWGGGPKQVRSLAVEHDGRGRLVVFAADETRLLWCGVDGVWHESSDYQVDGRPVAVRDHHGAVNCFTIEDTGLWWHRIAADQAEPGEPRRLGLRLSGHHPRVLGATCTPEGLVAVLVGGSDLLECAVVNDPMNDGRASCAVVETGPFRAASLGAGAGGDLEVLTVGQQDGALLRRRRLSPDMWAQPDTLTCPVPVEDVAFHHHRGGSTVVVAGRDGLFVRADDLDWRRLSGVKCGSLSLRPSRGWQLRLTAVSDGRVGYWTEEAPGVWAGHGLRFDG